MDRLAIAAVELTQHHAQAPGGDVFVGHEMRQASDALPLQRQMPHGFTAGGTDGRLDGPAVALGIPQRPLVEAIVLGKTDQGVVGQIRNTSGHTVGGDVVRAGKDIQRAAPQGAGMQGGVGQGADTNGNIGTLLQQVDNQVVAVEFELNLGVQRAKFRDVRHDGMQHEWRRGINAQAPGGGALMGDEALFQLVHLLKDLLGALEEELALFGQVHAPGGAIDQRGFELGLQA